MILLLVFCVLLAVQASSELPRPSPLLPDLCSVYDPFKVLPDNNKFQIGGSFPLHEDDCTRLRPDTVQEIVAIQWALTHWNQNPSHYQSKLGLYAGDTCSRAREALSQSLRFLDSVGYHQPKECRTDTAAIAKLLGLIAPKDYNSSMSLGTMLSVSELPVASYSMSSVRALLQLQVPNLISTTPSMTVYVEALIRLMGSLRSNLVTIVDDGKHAEVIRKVIEQLGEADIFVSETVNLNHPYLNQAVEDSDSDIVVSLLNKDQLSRIIGIPAVYQMKKLWIALPLEGESLSEFEQTTLLNKDAKLEVISLQHRFKELPQFRDYFLRVLKNNYQSYQLLTSYVQQVYNCTGDTCSVSKEAMQEKYKQAPTVQSVLSMTYAFAAVGKAIVEDSAKEALCSHPSPACTDLIMEEFMSLDYHYDINDPSELSGERITFYKGRDNSLLVSGMTIDAIELYNDETGPMVYKLLSYTTGHQPTVVVNSIRPVDQRLRSICSPYRPFCGQCPNVQSVSGDKHFLSIPRHYPMYLIGLFDLHSGPICNSMKNTDISLPMAFVHTVWSFRQRFPQLNLLKNLDFGALLVDSCSSGKQAIETVVLAETHCFRFQQAGRNLTIVPGSVFGYVSALHGDSQEAVKGYFSSGDTDAALVAVDAEHSAFHQSFSAMPSGRSQALALLRLLSRMQWQFVTVALSEQDPECLSAFRHFERLALDRGVCLAEVVNIGGVRVDNLPIGTSTNVTVVFATSRDAAAYLSLTLRSPRKAIHVMMGDAHDWHLHEESNKDKFVGTVSVQPKDILYGDFREWMETTTPLSLPEMWYWALIEDRWQCALTQKSKLVYGKMCTGDELLDVQSLGRMTKTGYLARGVERFLFAMDSVYKKLCPQQNGLCMEFYEKGRRLIMNQLKKTAVEDDVEVYEYMADDTNESYSYRSIGNWSVSSGLRLHSLYRFVDGGSAVVSKCQPPMCKCFLDGDFLQRPLDSFVMESEIVGGEVSSGSYVKMQPAYGSERVAYKSIFDHLSSGEWRTQPLNFVLLALITISLIIAVAVLLLVLVKLYLRVVKGNQSLGISLLVGIIMLYFTAYFFVFDATDTVCRARVILHGLGYTICFGVMIAKATQLRNAETLGFGSSVHISFWNYWMLLFFIIGVQIALSTRWLTEPFMSTISSIGGKSVMVCTLGKEEFVLSNIYVIILLFLALFINTRNRNIKRNYKETKWLFVSAVACTLIWVTWIILYFSVPYNIREIVVVCELLLCSSLLLGFLFGPKIYILLSYEPVVVQYKPDQNAPPNVLFEKEDDQPSIRAISPASSTDSSGHRTASIYSGRRQNQQANGSSGSGNYSDDQSPIFHTVMRKKNKVRRTNSEHQMQHPQQMTVFPEVPVIRSPSHNDSLPSRRHRIVDA